MRRTLIVAGMLALCHIAVADEWQDMLRAVGGNSFSPNVIQASRALLEKYPMDAPMAGDDYLAERYAQATVAVAYYLGNRQTLYQDALGVTGAYLTVFWRADTQHAVIVHGLHLRYLVKAKPPPQEALQFAQAARQRVHDGLTVVPILDADFGMAEYLNNLLALYKQGGQLEEGLSLLVALPLFRPDLIHDVAYWAVLAAAYTGRGEFDKAKQAAVLSFRLCSFDQDAVRESLGLLLGPLTLAGDSSQGETFLQYIKAGEGDNPLAQVPMPQLTDEQVDLMLMNTGGLFGPLVNAYLYAGRFDQALETAQMEAASLGNNIAPGVRDIARCFKAKDMHLIRANQFIEWVKTGHGQNPLEDF